MNSRILVFLILIIALFSLSACNNPSDSNGPGDHIQINSWIHANMDFYYFWNERVPEKADGYMTPSNFFYSMLEQNDEFSYISDNAEGLLDGLNGTSFTSGISPSFGQFSNSNSVFVFVEFVYPNTPAEEAGIKRGDFILEINGTPLSVQNYQNLYYQTGDAAYTLGTYNPDDNTISPSDTVSVSKAELSLDPVVYSTVIDTGSHKIGYLFYAEFLTGEQNKFIHSVDSVLSNFQNAGITDFVIDLRYNPGGRVVAAENLANSIAPPTVSQNESVFINYEYNENLENYYRENGGENSPDLVSRFSSDPVNLNLNRVYFLTTNSTASASELLIHGLDPYMEVIHIGSPTYGKFYGSYVLTGMNADPAHNYAIVPVTLKYANADGISDFSEGLTPDIEAEDDFRFAYQIGDLNDPLLSKALSHITGVTAPPAKALPPSTFIKLPDSKRLNKGNIFFEESPVSQ